MCVNKNVYQNYEYYLSRRLVPVRRCSRKMANVQIDVVSGFWRNEEIREGATKCRLEVFVNEQQIPRELELDGQDQGATHFVAFVSKVPVGNARLLPDGHIGRMCVLKSHRTRGIGSLLLDNVIQTAKQKRFEKLVLESQLHAMSFYEKFGFVVNISRLPFEVASIPHVEMVLVL